MKIELKTIFDHKNRILRTLAYIDDHLDEPLTLKGLSRIACLSEYHFHRSFREYLGITLSGYLRGLRLTRATEMLERSDMRIIDLALSVGYESGEAFTKAFGKAFGISPSHLRKQMRRDTPKIRGNVTDSFNLIPCTEAGVPVDGKNLGKEAYLELQRLGSQIQLQDVISPWISVFPHFHNTHTGEHPEDTPTRVQLGSISYLVKPFFSHNSFQVLDCGRCGIFHDHKKPIVFRRAGEIMPDFSYQGLHHLPQLPMRLRSILLVPHRSFHTH